jgi:NAD(P)-dependent dehydrogenase (short-subunit alcohol dehydrogenase family)
VSSRRTGTDLAAKVAIVTGGGSGVGAAITRALVAAGAEVVCTDIDGEAARRVVASLDGAGHAEALALDVTDAAAVKDVVDSVVSRTGRIDFMFNNAGIVYVAPVEDLTLDQWNRIVDVNLRGVVHGVAAAYPHMINARRGHIINTASAAGLMASGLVTSYATTKYAVVGLSLALRTEAAGYGVGVTAICPSAVETPLLDKGGAGDINPRRFFLEAEKTTKAYDVDRLAQDVLRAIRRNDPLLVVPRRTRLGWVVSRVAPGVTLRMTTNYVARQRRT